MTAAVGAMMSLLVRSGQATAGEARADAERLDKICNETARHTDAQDCPVIARPCDPRNVALEPRIEARRAPANSHNEAGDRTSWGLGWIASRP